MCNCQDSRYSREFTRQRNHIRNRPGKTHVSMLTHLALRAVHRYLAVAGYVGKSSRKNILALAVYSWASPERANVKLVELEWKRGQQ